MIYFCILLPVFFVSSFFASNAERKIKEFSWHQEFQNEEKRIIEEEKAQKKREIKEKKIKELEARPLNFSWR